jgi:hypothetical protein
MKKILFFILVLFAGKSFAQDYNTSITFPANYQVGDYVEFVGVAPISAGSSGYYEISIAYTRGNVAAAATHLASIAHANPALWREVGRINDNPYVSAGKRNFTIDCNTEYANPRFRIRGIATNGVATPITVYINVHAINYNSAWTALNNSGNDLTVTKFLPMTNEWNLYVGNNYSSAGASLAIKAIENGNVGIGTNQPDEKLTVYGKIHAQEVKVDLSVPGPDYVFHPTYKLPTLTEVKAFIDKNQHLAEIPSAAEMAKNGLDLGDMNVKLLKKVEELTLYLIEKDEEINDLKQQKTINQTQQNQIDELRKQVETLLKKKS